MNKPKYFSFGIFLVIILAACTPATTPPTTEMPVPVTRSTPTAIILPTQPTPIPTQLIIPMITPDAMQVGRWQEYETALAKSLFSSHTPESFLCEWDILGRSGQEIYVWVVCDIPRGGCGASAPAIIYLNLDKSIENVEILGKSSDYSADILKLPLDVQHKLDSYQSRGEKTLWEHLKWRQSHPEIPPLIVLSAVPTGTPIPTQLIIPVITPDVIQVERWQEYQTELAKSLLSFLPPEEVLCEWEILGRSGQEVYLWAVCTGGMYDSSTSTSVLIHLEADGAVQSVEIPGSGSKRNSNILKMFPAYVRDKFASYHFGGAMKMSEHIDWRQSHPETPPLIVLSATPVP